MKQLITFTSLSLFTFQFVQAQGNFLPQNFSPEEQGLMEDYLETREASSRGISSPPPFSNIRTAAEWEEVQSLVMTWTGQFNSIQSQIVDAAQEECEVIIMTDDSSGVKSQLGSYGVPLTNVKFVNTDFNSIWIRDYGANTVYGNEVDTLFMVDWIYNRPRPLDDVIPDAYCLFKGINLYSMTSGNNRIMATGGNWMSDGFQRAFSSELILDENDGSGDYGLNYPNHTPSEIDNLYQTWLGITNYIKMTVLPYDDIHHIDMHIKLLDEKTLLVGKFPNGISDGPQLEANIQYVLSNYTNHWGEPFDIVRIPMVPSSSGGYPSGGWGEAYYRTYANQIFVNKTVLLPTYRQQYDTTALRILGEELPGYNIVPIDVDNSGQNLISNGGAIHCITHTIGVADPLLISHNSLSDTYDTSSPYVVNAYVRHKSGISAATLYYKTTLNGSYTSVNMTNSGNNIWVGNIPAQPAGTTIYYYVRGTSNSGKELARPITAPEGFWKFNVLSGSVGIGESNHFVGLGNVYPNPAKSITAIPVTTLRETKGKIALYNILGEEIKTIFEGTFNPLVKHYFFDASILSKGVYQVVINTETGVQSQSVIVE